MSPKMKFAEEEKVLCFHGPLLYEAKCIRGEMKDKVFRYFVHYNGWNKNWDEWVPESRILKFNEASLQKQKELQKAHAVKNKASKGARVSEKEKDKETSKEKEEPKDNAKAQANKSTPSAAKDKKGTEKDKEKEKEKDKDKEKEKEREKSRQSTPSTETKKQPVSSSQSSTEQVVNEKLSDNMPLSELMKKKRTRQSDVASQDSPAVTESTSTTSSSEPPKKKRARVDPTVESKEMFLTKIEVRIKIPDELKPWLVDDWDLVTRQKQLVSLPCKMNVENILEDYVKTKLSKQNHAKDAILEVTQGIKEYFNVMLGTQLLYKFERQQYSEMLSKFPDLPMSQVYGATHLLRLFVKLGGMLAYTPLDEKSLQLLLNHLHDFLKYVARSASNLFSVSDYAVAPPDYHRKAI